MPTTAEGVPLLHPDDPPVEYPRRNSVVGVITVAIACVLAFSLLPFYALIWYSSSSNSASSTVSDAHVMRILAVGDWGREGHHGQRAVARSMSSYFDVQKKHRNALPYIISTGDNFYDVGVESVSDKQFNTSFHYVYNGAYRSLRNAIWLPVFGNHDHLGNTAAQLQYSKTCPVWHFKSHYYTRRISPFVRAIFLDTTPFVQDKAGARARSLGHNPLVQVKWLREQLERTTSEPYFMIIAHHNMYTMSKAGHYGDAELRRLVEPILLEHSDRILAYVSGHEHALMHMQPVHKNGVSVKPLNHFISGAGSRLDPVIPPPGNPPKSKWRTKRGVVTSAHGEGRWALSKHGFFEFQFWSDGMFVANAYGTDMQLLYRFRQQFTPPARMLRIIQRRNTHEKP